MKMKVGRRKGEEEEEEDNDDGSGGGLICRLLNCLDGKMMLETAY